MFDNILILSIFLVYDLAKMELETVAKRIENKDKYVRKFHHNTFSVSKYLFCFSQGINYIM